MTLSQDEKLPSIEEEPRYADVQSDLTVYTVAASEDEENSENAAIDGDNLKYQLDTKIVHVLKPIENTRALSGSAEVGLAPSGLLTVDSANERELISRVLIAHVESLRSIVITVKQDVGVWASQKINQAIAVNTLADVGKVHLYTTAGVLVNSYPFIPELPVTIPRRDIEDAGNGGYVDVVLEYFYKLVAQKTAPFNCGEIVVYQFDFKNKIESMFVKFAAGGIAGLVGKEITDYIRKFIEDSSMGGAMGQFNMLGIDVGSIIAGIGAGLVLRADADPDFDMFEAVTTDLLQNIMGLLKEMTMQFVGGLGISAVGAVLAKSGMMPSTINKVLPYATSLGSALLISSASISYFGTRRLYVYAP